MSNNATTEKRVYDKKGTVKLLFHYNKETNEYKVVTLKQLPDTQEGFGNFLLTARSGTKNDKTNAKEVISSMNVSELAYFVAAGQEMLRGAVRTRIDVGE